MNKEKVVLIFGLLIIVIIVIMLAFKSRKKVNPIMAEIQMQINGQVGSGFQISEANLYNEERIDAISIFTTTDQLKNGEIFAKVNCIKEIVFEYARNHSEYFDFNPKRYDGDNGFYLYIRNSDLLSSPQRQTTIFSFCNYIENEKEFSEDYVALYCTSYNFKTENGYGYNLSQLKELKNVKELQARCFEIDDVKILGEMEGLQYFFANIERAKNEEDYEDLKNAVEKQGITFDPW